VEKVDGVLLSRITKGIGGGGRDALMNLIASTGKKSKNSATNQQEGIGYVVRTRKMFKRGEGADSNTWRGEPRLDKEKLA